MIGSTWLAAIGISLLLGGSPQAEAERFNHDDWATVLEQYVDESGLVDYRGLSRDRRAFDRYVARIRSVGPETDPALFPERADEFAYYLNAYNAQVFAGVLERGPEEESVWSGWISGYKFFAAMKIVVGGDRTSLRDLENDLIRPRFKDARLHAALNCASIGCPRLPREPFVGARLDEQLESAMRGFINDRQQVVVDSAGRSVTLSKIFDWFREDFIDDEKRHGNSDPKLLDFVNRFRDEDARIPRDYRVEFAPYDKRINKQ